MAAGYFVGLLTGVVMMGLVLVYVGYRIGGPDWLRKLNPWRDTVRVSAEVLSDLAALDAVLSNTRTRIESDDHDTILVRPDPELVSVLRPEPGSPSTCSAPPSHRTWIRRCCTCGPTTTCRNV